MPAEPSTPDGVAYADAVAELEEILAELESDDPDVDVLTVRVRRAAELIRLCRSRINVARDEVERVVASLDGTASPEDDEQP
jgi:exodeoxyribonuclease VII small subunit